MSGAPDSDLSHRRKLDRAQFHTREVEAAIRAWTDSKGHRTFQEVQSDGTVKLRAQQLRALPSNLGLVIGDALQGLRNSLDNLAFTLAKANTPHITPEQEERVAFPILDAAPALGDKRIALMSEAAQNDVCELAPDGVQLPLKEHPLWLLDKTANRDKHREVHTVVAVGALHNVGIRAGMITHLQMFGAQNLELDAEPVTLMEWRASGLQMDVGTRVGVLFGRGIEVENRDVLATLRWFHDHIRDVVFPRLEKYLQVCSDATQ